MVHRVQTRKERLHTNLVVAGLPNMSRKTVRSLKRALRAISRIDTTPGDRLLRSQSALALLSRSIRFGHGRLALLRLATAVELGAQVPGEHWMYCMRVAAESTDLRLQELYTSAAELARASANSTQVSRVNSREVENPLEHLIVDATPARHGR